MEQAGCRSFLGKKWNRASRRGRFPTKSLRNEGFRGENTPIYIYTRARSSEKLASGFEKLASRREKVASLAEKLASGFEKLTSRREKVASYLLQREKKSISSNSFFNCASSSSVRLRKGVRFRPKSSPMSFMILLPPTMFPRKRHMTSITSCA